MKKGDKKKGIGSRGRTSLTAFTYKQVWNVSNNNQLINLIPPLFKLAYVQYIKLKSRYNFQTRHFDMFA